MDAFKKFINKDKSAEKSGDKPAGDKPVDKREEAMNKGVDMASKHFLGSKPKEGGESGEKKKTNEEKAFGFLSKAVKSATKV
ncbi:hypothetical protein FQN54_000024 [Arachnomyces sp. PD_36]|nr:hypothetical protein FQN54_000024 [Arachnomyces sp. PD_36]